jgi:hypothetical protein
MKPQPIEPNMPLNVVMTAAEWENVINVLRKAPYEQVANAIQAIVGQCMTGGQIANPPTDQG